jgi:hypothetical protein
LSLDIADFFPSISKERVEGLAVSEQGIFAEAIAAFYPDGKDPATMEILTHGR